jgi:hypothetical protein
VISTTTVIYYEFFLNYFYVLSDEREKIISDIKRGKCLQVNCEKLHENIIRMHEAENIFLKMKVWFD